MIRIVMLLTAAWVGVSATMFVLSMPVQPIQACSFAAPDFEGDTATAAFIALADATDVGAATNSLRVPNINGTAYRRHASHGHASWRGDAYASRRENGNAHRDNDPYLDACR